ncbi:MAG: hemerythrin domain-containing protein [Defluviitaleaceae bacterium]|nr:hemerythrin domain-containing protein [Defluviitaleaceae bacterium]
MWKDSYLIGNEKIDNQHRELLKNAEILMESFENLDEAEYKKFFSGSLGFLKDYVVNHFRDEEEYARYVGYADAERHKALHDKLTQDVLSYEGEFADTDFSQPVIERFLGFIYTWITYHVADEDQLIPKGVATEAKTVSADEIIYEFVNKVSQVLGVVAGIPEQEIRREFNSAARLLPIARFRVCMTGYSRAGVEFAFSKGFAIGVFKGITGIESREISEIIYSALSELSNILGSRFAEILTASGEVCLSEKPIKADSDIHETDIMQRILLDTRLGGMEVIIFNK